MASEIEELKKLVLAQGKEIKRLKKRVDAFETASPPPVEEEPEPEPQPVETPVKTAKENPTSPFKVFGIVGILLILLGVVYFYKYAVDQGWIGITGRVALGIIAAFILLGFGFLLHSKGYTKFSQLIFAIGLGVAYFTIFATYHFTQYREALGMSLMLNTILLLIIMLAGTTMGIKLNARFVAYGSLLLGFIAAFLSGIDGDSLHILIYVLLIDVFVLVVAKIKSWYVGIPAQVLTFIAYSIWFFQGITSPSSILAQTSSPIFITFIFLLLYYVFFVVLAFIQSSDNREAECVALMVINTVCLASFGLGIVNEYLSEANGVFLMIAAAISLMVGFMSQKQGFSKTFDIMFLATLILIAIAIPVQFDYAVVTVLWALMAIGLSYAGLRINHTRLFIVGYLGYLIVILRVLFFDFFQSDDMQRWISVGAGFLGLIVLQIMVLRLANDDAKKDGLFNFYSVVGIVMGMLWIYREVYTALDAGVGHVTSSILLALYGIVVIWYGVALRRKVFNWTGTIIFGHVVLKVVFVDLNAMENIMRVLALIIVGVLALVGSFVFVKNKEKLKELF
ncbi:MAG: DUF2339 domain-containing protein [archaeon]